MAKDDATQLYETEIELSLSELCTAYHTTPEFVLELMAYGTVEPKGEVPEAWRFNVQQLQVVRTAMHLHHDLEVNHAGIALAVDLLTQIKELQMQLDTLHKYFFLSSEIKK